MDKAIEAGPEEAANLAHLESLISAEPVAGEPVPEVPAVTPAESLGGLLQMMAMAANFAGFRNTAAVWNPDACNGFAEKAVPVLAKYAWGVRALEFLETGAGVEEFALAMFAFPLVMATVGAARLDMQPPEKPVEKKPEEDQPQAPVMAEVQP